MPDVMFYFFKILTLIFCFKILVQTTVYFLKTLSRKILSARIFDQVLKEGTPYVTSTAATGWNSNLELLTVMSFDVVLPRLELIKRKLLKFVNL